MEKDKGKRISECAHQHHFCITIFFLDSRDKFGQRSVGKNYSNKPTTKTDKSGLLMRRKESLAS